MEIKSHTVFITIRRAFTEYAVGYLAKEMIRSLRFKIKQVEPDRKFKISEGENGRSFKVKKVVSEKK